MQWPKIKLIHRKSELWDCERQQSKMLSSLPCLFILDQCLYHASFNSKLSFPIMNTKHSPLCPIRGGITHCLRTWKKRQLTNFVLENTNCDPVYTNDIVSHELKIWQGHLLAQQYFFNAVLGHWVLVCFLNGWVDLPSRDFSVCQPCQLHPAVAKINNLYLTRLDPLWSKIGSNKCER